MECVLRVYCSFDRVEFVDIGNLVGGIGQAVGSIGGLFSAGRANDIAAQNLQLQRDTYGYQKDLQQQMFEREDSSVQRRVADLKAANISPILAAGQGARAGAPISVTAPQRSTAPQEMMLKGLSQVRDIGLTAAQTALTLAQKEKTQVETGKGKVDLQFLQDTLRLRTVSEQAHNDARAAVAGLSRVEADRLRAYIAAVKGGGQEGTGVPVRMTRSMLEYETAKLLQELTRKDLEFYELIKGSGAGAQIGNVLLRFLGQILGRRR